MFKIQYQGGPYVDVFSAQGREKLTKKCKVIGSSSSISKEYDKDVKSSVYILKGEPTTTKLHFPKDDKLGLFLTQRFIVFQLFTPLGQPFSFEVTITDHTQNKRRIFFSSNLKDASVTPLHAKFPLNCIKHGFWLNMCLDLESLVKNTFHGSTCRSLEGFTVTANCRLKRVFTLRSPPMDNSELGETQYDHYESLPRNVQLITSGSIPTMTQILSYTTLQGKHIMTTPRKDHETSQQLTHIAFGSKVVIPSHARLNSLKENKEPCQSSCNTDTINTTEFNESSKTLASSDWDMKNGIVLGVDVAIKPRPPKTSSAGKVRRRPLRVKSSDTVKDVEEEKNNKDHVSTKTVSKNEPWHKTLEKNIFPDCTTSESGQDIGIIDKKFLDKEKLAVIKNSVKKSTSSNELFNDESSAVSIVLRKMSNNMQQYENSMSNKTPHIPFNVEQNLLCQGLQHENVMTGEENISFKTKVSDSTLNKKSPEEKPLIEFDSSNEEKKPNFVENGTLTSSHKNLATGNYTQSIQVQIDFNNNDGVSKDAKPNRPCQLQLANNNPVFTFASIPRSPRSGMKKFMDMPPEVTVSLIEPEGEEKAYSNERGVSLEDDFCCLSEEEKDDSLSIQKLLESSFSPRYSPLPSHHHLRQSIRSSMLKEIASPVHKDLSYDAENYQSSVACKQQLNQSTASSWRFDLSSSNDSVNQTCDWENSLNGDAMPKHLVAIADIPQIDEVQSDSSDDTTCSTWRAPPQELKGNKYRNEMKPPGKEPDLTATIDMAPRDSDTLASPIEMLQKSPLNITGSDQEEELDLLYDPCLNCYFDPRTHKYYELA
ncbi:protein CFAP20DC-like isoform X2 [Xenia sp. Carnegie-2017]|uniref:protein CFAP20DC-like isoform X2 n=1 Tax=Xenia sp. Carnegie-2017 TaxID=2897299 RepID=UPI001F0398ED|nr:protein CFAP20DC-like isoform X2 [Xenia sp. Carnegie-2017]